MSDCKVFIERELFGTAQIEFLYACLTKMWYPGYPSSL